MALENNSPAESGAVSRRTIIKGAAWAAPVMIAAVAVPAAVASVPTSFAADPSSWKKGESRKVNLLFAGFGSGTVRLTFVDATHPFHFTTASGSTSYVDVTITDNVGSVDIFGPNANKATVILRASQTTPLWSLDQTLTMTN